MPLSTNLYVGAGCLNRLEVSPWCKKRPRHLLLLYLPYLLYPLFLLPDTAGGKQQKQQRKQQQPTA